MKLNEIQAKLKAPKNNFNSFGNYKYRSCEDILEAVKPLLGESTLTLSDDVVQIGDRIYVKATAVFRDGATETKVSAFAREAESRKGMDDSQVTGTASSYARKYALNGLFLIDDTKDADTFEPEKEEAKPSRKKKVEDTILNVKQKDDKMTPLQKSKIQRLTSEEQFAKLVETYGEPETWTSAQADKWIEQLERRTDNA